MLKIVLLALSLFIIGALGKSLDETKRINPKECGLRYRGEIERYERFSASKRARQKELGWQVALNYSNSYRSGTLINSQWILTEAYYLLKFDSFLTVTFRLNRIFYLKFYLKGRRKAQ
jgi:hypothetical protein